MPAHHSPAPFTDPSTRKHLLVTGVLFIITFVAAIAGYVLYGPVLDDAGYVLGGGADTQIKLGALCEIVLVIANIGTALALFPLLKRTSESLSLGFVASRIVESTVIAVGLISLLAVVTLRQAPATAADSSLLARAQALVAVHDWTVLLGPGLCVGVGNGLILGYLMYKSGIVPRRMAILGLVGGPLLFVSSTLALFGVHEQMSGSAFLMTVPEIAWEASLGIYLTVMSVRAGRSAAGARPLTPAPAAA